MLNPAHDRRCVVGFPALHVVLLAVLVAWSGEGVRAAPADAPALQRDAVRDAVSRAGRNVDEAWAAFHRNALGGTLASPAIQAKIERALHEARRLLTAARAAAQSNDQHAVYTFTRRIEDIAAQIQHDSHMSKP